MAIVHLETTVVDLVDTWATSTPNATAAEWNGQQLSYASLRDASLHVSKALLSVGVRPGDKIPILSQMSLELLPAILGVLRVGACYVPIDMAAWSKARIDATLEDISSQVAIATDKLDTRKVPVCVFFQERWLELPFHDKDDTCCQLDTIRRSLVAEALVYITFTSGTTGKPKGVMIYHRALYGFVSLRDGDCFNTAPGQRVLLAFSISFDACAATIWTTITRGGSLVMATWSSFPELSTTCDNLMLTPSMLASLDPAGPYEKVSSLFLGAEATNFDIARQWITPTRKVIHTYGPSEATIIISFGRVPDDTEPDLGVLIPGVEVAIVDENLQETDTGEILIIGPCLAAGYLNNPELTAKKFIQWNGKRVYRTGDLAKRTKSGLSWIARADRMVKNRGFLVNLETEVESGILRFANVRAASAFMWRNKLVGFVQPAYIKTDELRLFMKQNFDPFVVPDEFVAVDQFPLTAHGKVDRVALSAQLECRMAKEDAELNSLICNSSYDALRWAFAKCLQVPFGNLNRNSSFAHLGGNSLAAIRLSRFLAQQGYTINIPYILSEDTIDRLQAKLVNVNEHEATNSNGAVSELVPVHDMHRIMLSQTEMNPLINSLVVSAKFKGPHDSIPTPSELKAAWTSTLSAHSVFKTRYDMQNWTLHDIDHLNMDWEEIGVETEDFGSTLLSFEDQVWAHHKTIQKPRLDVPFCHMTCVYAPDRKAIGFVWRVQHVLGDPFSLLMLMNDLEQALSKKELTPGPRIKDYARFMQKYKSENLTTATEFWERMMNPLSERSLFDFRPPQTSVQGDWLVMPFATGETVESIEASATKYGISSATITFAAWALVLARYTGSNVSSFILSRSGRMAPWPQAPSLVASMNCRVPFATTIPLGGKLQGWLTSMHSTLHRVSELENLSPSLDASICPAAFFKSVVVASLHTQQSPANWEIHDRLTGQAEPIGMVWRVQRELEGSEAVEATLEIDRRVVDVEWGKEVGTVAAGVLARLTNAPNNTKLQDLLLS
ncbi:acetyl-CoA synthetase-like protein [Penicillium angulare]|uniref:acetyl-CoA synthetase-like protein n=1 Tax=Penicillium angulare TaxID=116970 RepID=UPI0025421389|nr:acetyl-CoA synthetase-like protein [Penicillium angulare]KAJ5259402.1 acetyl-CoA synthetase-like protein [Penicillium angulare]